MPFVVADIASREYWKFVKDNDDEPAVRVVGKLQSGGGTADTTASQLLSSGALSTTTALTGSFILSFVAVKFSAAVSQTVTVTMDSAGGSNYDTIIERQVLVNNTDYFYEPEAEMSFLNGNQINVTVTNSGSPGVTAYVTIGTRGI